METIKDDRGAIWERKVNHWGKEYWVRYGKGGRKYIKRPEEIQAKTHHYCFGCKQILPINCFYRLASGKDGLTDYCKCCTEFLQQQPERERFKKRYEEYKQRREQESL